MTCTTREATNESRSIKIQQQQNAGAKHVTKKREREQEKCDTPNQSRVRSVVFHRIEIHSILFNSRDYYSCIFIFVLFCIVLYCIVLYCIYGTVQILIYSL